MLPVAGALARSVASNYINPIKLSAKKLMVEKGIKNRIWNALDLSVSVTTPYINAAGQLGKTTMQKAALITGATLVPLTPDIKNMYEKRKLKQQMNNQVNANFSFINPGAIGGTIVGGMFGLPGAMIGGIAGEMLYDKIQKERKIKQDLLNSLNGSIDQNLSNQNNTNTNIISNKNTINNQNIINEYQGE